MIRVENISKRYKGDLVLECINWEIEDDAFVILTGRSGGGKTTLLSIMGGLAKPDEGRVLIDGDDIWQLPEPELAVLRNRKLGFVFQFPSLIPTLSMLDNVLLPIAFSGVPPALQDRDRVRTLLEMVGLQDKEHLYPSQLSGGQQRRVAIARALVNSPSIILTDEPTGDLDERTEDEIMRLFKEISDQGTTVVMVTHALNYVKLSGATYTLKHGRLLPYEEDEVAPDVAASRRRIS